MQVWYKIDWWDCLVWEIILLYTVFRAKESIKSYLNILTVLCQRKIFSKLNLSVKTILATYWHDWSINKYLKISYKNMRRQRWSRITYWTLLDPACVKLTQGNLKWPPFWNGSTLCYHFLWILVSDIIHNSWKSWAGQCFAVITALMQFHGPTRDSKSKILVLLL